MIFWWPNLGKSWCGLVNVVFRLQNKFLGVFYGLKGMNRSNFGNFESLNSYFDALTSILPTLVIFWWPNLEKSWLRLVKVIFGLQNKCFVVFVALKAPTGSI